jgi:hypothetical protein
MPNNINDILLNVRKAYRLLFEYQKRILDLVSFIGGSFGFSYRGGYPKFSNPSPQKGKGNLNNWSWDWLNMYCYQFAFGSKKTNDTTIAFAVVLINDTGYYQSNNTKQIHQTNVSAFDRVENSQSKLVLVAGKNTQQVQEWFTNDFIFKESGTKGENDKIMIFKSYSIQNFETEDKALYSLKEFQNMCQKYNISLSLIEKKI